jgi:hypothetical protein
MAGSRVPLPPYPELQTSVRHDPPYSSEGDDLDFQLDWQSVKSSESYTTIEKPEPATVKA